MNAYPAIIARRFLEESEEEFQGRKDQCRNATHAAGFPSPDRHEGNIFDESTYTAGVLNQLGEWPAVFAYEAGDLADTRDAFADVVQAIEDAGSGLILVKEGIDLRNNNEANAPARKAFGVWLELPGTGEDVEAEENAEGTAGDGKELRRPKGMDEDMERITREHFAEHGTTKPSELKKKLGITSNGTAKNWLVWAEKNPLPSSPPADVEEE